MERKCEQFWTHSINPMTSFYIMSHLLNDPAFLNFRSDSHQSRSAFGAEAWHANPAIQKLCFGCFNYIYIYIIGGF